MMILPGNFGIFSYFPFPIAIQRSEWAFLIMHAVLYNIFSQYETILHNTSQDTSNLKISARGDLIQFLYKHGFAEVSISLFF